MATLQSRTAIINFLKANAPADHPVFDMINYELPLNAFLDTQDAKDKDFTGVFFDASQVEPRTVQTSGLFRETGSFKLYIGAAKQRLNNKASYLRVIEHGEWWADKLRSRRIGDIVLTDYTTLDETSFDSFTKKAFLLTAGMSFSYYVDIVFR